MTLKGAKLPIRAYYVLTSPSNPEQVKHYTHRIQKKATQRECIGIESGL